MGRNLKRKERAASEADMEWVSKHDDDMRLWNNAVAEVVSFAIRHTSVSAFAKQIRYTRSTLSSLLNQKDAERQRPWTFDTLVSISDALGCELSSFIKAVEYVRKNNGAEPPLSIRFSGTAPFSRERLQRIIYEAVGYNGEHDEARMKKLEQVLYRVSDVEYANPELCKAYYKGRLSDSEILSLIKKAYSDGRKSDKSMPLWAAVKGITL